MSTDGNTSKIVLWLADTAIVRKPMPDKSFYFVADAVTGAPIAKANVEFFGYRQRHIDGNNYQVDTKNFAEHDRRRRPGVAANARRQQGRHRNANYQWLATATTDGRPAGVPRLPQRLAGPVSTTHSTTKSKTFAITDRPVYRPGQTVEFKFWIRQAQYDMEDKSRFAHQAFAVEIHNPKGEKVYSETLTADNYGGLAGKFELPATPRSASISCSSSITAAARSASRNTRSRSSKSRSTRRPSR